MVNYKLFINGLII